MLFSTQLRQNAKQDGPHHSASHTIPYPFGTYLRAALILIIGHRDSLQQQSRPTVRADDPCPSREMRGLLSCRGIGRILLP